jgi:hypothetical protein
MKKLIFLFLLYSGTALISPKESYGQSYGTQTYQFSITGKVKKDPLLLWIR